MSILDFAYSPNLCYSIHECFCISSLVSYEDFSFRCLLRNGYGVEVAVTQRQRLFHKHVLVMLEGEDCMGRMKASSVAQQNRVDI
jgi:hypothetical protein